MHEALSWRYRGAFSARAYRPSYEGHLPQTWRGYLAPPWWEETGAPLWRYVGRR